MTSRAVRLALSGLCAGFFWSTLTLAAPADDGSTAPLYTQAQAQAGAKVFEKVCISCHGDKLQGGAGPTLIGTGFIGKWTSGGKSVEDFRKFMQATMPADKAGSLSEGDSYDVIAFIMSRNGYPAGEAPLSGVTAWQLFPPPEGFPKKAHITKPLPAAPETVAQATTRKPDDAELSHQTESEWLAYNGDLTGQHYSTLDQITAKNAKRLAVHCIYQLGEIGSFQSSPIVYDGVVYVTSPYRTYAFNATNCAPIWTHNYYVDMPSPVWTSRGAAIYRGKIFRVTPNGHLIALDSKTGKLLWDALLCDETLGYWLSAAPVAYDGKVFIGLAGADFGADGHIYALDADTGRVVWTFNPIPTGKEVGAETWRAGADHGGGSTWSTYTIDPKNGLFLASIGNPAPDYDGEARPGDNLFTDSVVALDYKTGAVKWWVQQVPHDLHDWDTAAAPTLYDQDGKHYLAVGSKGGWLYLYDRATRKLLAQPEISSHLNTDIPLSVEGVRHCPGIVGGVEWNGVTYSPREKLIYVNSVDWCGVSKYKAEHYVEGRAYFGGTHAFDPPEMAKGWTRAFDAATGAAGWVRESKTPMVAALTPTAGGVVFTGDLNGNFLALDAHSGETLYQFNTGGALAGGVSTYKIGDTQYVAATSGNQSRSVWKSTGAMTVILFSLRKD